jgi:hypothetical protein
MFVIFLPSYQLLGFLEEIYFILSATAFKAMRNTAKEFLDAIRILIPSLFLLYE